MGFVTYPWQFCQLEDGNKRKRTFIHHFILWLKWILLALSVGVTFSEQFNSPLSYRWHHRQHLTLDLDWLHSTNQEGARYQDKCLVLLWLSKAVFSACFLSSSGLWCQGFSFPVYSLRCILSSPSALLVWFCPHCKSHCCHSLSWTASKNYASIPFTDKFSHLSMDSLHLVSTQTWSHRIGLTESPTSAVYCWFLLDWQTHE